MSQIRKRFRAESPKPAETLLLANIALTVIKSENSR